MTNLSKDFREELKKVATVTDTKIKVKQVSKDGTKLVLTLVSGEDESKQFYNACIKLDNSQKTHAKVEKGGKHALIKVVMLENKQPKAEANAEDMPF